MDNLIDLLTASQARHSHLCPRQVLGIRIALAGLRALDINPTDQRRRLLVISETDGCFADGIEVTAQVSVGHRTLKINDYGKIAATFIDLKTHQAIRLRPAANVRELARTYVPLAKRPYFAQLKGYQVIPDCELLNAEWVTLTHEIEQIMGSPRQRAFCRNCGEEIINGREIVESEVTLCMACAGQAYYQVAQESNRLDGQIGLISAA